MKKYVFILFLTIQLSAFDTQTASKIFNKIFTAIFSHEPITVYTVNKEYQDVIKWAKSLRLVSNPTLADIVLVDKWSEIPKNKSTILFTTNPAIFEKNENAIGAFYWEHGRPKIIFLQNRLNKQHMELMPSFHRYIVRELP